MLGSSIMASSNTMDGRMFIYEVEGLKENDQTAQAASPIRNSATALFPVPYARMNTFMQRIGYLGGKIVAIHGSWDAAVKAADLEEGDLDSPDKA